MRTPAVPRTEGPDTSSTPRGPVIPVQRRTAGGRKPLTIAQVCEELDIARSTFYEWRAKGLAPRCIKLPNREIRIRVTDYEKWLESLEDAA